MDVSDFQRDQHFWNAATSHPFLGDLTIVIIPEYAQQPPTKRQLAAADAAITLPPSLESGIHDAALQYCTEVCQFVDFEEELEIARVTAANIGNHFRITDVVIPRLGAGTRQYIFLCGECDWDPEHGIEFLIENNSILRCGQQNCLYLNAEWNDFITVCP